MNLKTLIKKSTLFYVGKVIDAVMMLFFNILVARKLGAVAYGEYVYMVTFIIFFSILVKIGVDQGLMAILPKIEDKKTKGSIIAFSIFIVLVMAMMAIIVTFIFKNIISNVILNDPSLTENFVYIYPLIIIFPLIQLLEGIFKAIGKVETYVIIKSVFQPFMFIISFILFDFILDVSGFTLAIFSNYAAFYLTFFYLLIVLIKDKDISYNFWGNSRKYKELIKISLPLIFTGLVTFFVGKIDVYMVGFMMGKQYSGIFNMSHQIAFMSGFILVAFNSVFAPAVTRLYYENKIQDLKNLYIRTTRYILLLNLVFLALIYINKDILMGVFGDDFLQGADALVTYTIAYLMYSIFGGIIYMNAMTGNQKAEFYINNLCVILNIFLNIPLIKNYGMNGAAIASFLIFSLASILRLYIMHKNQGIHPFNGKYFLSIIAVLAPLLLAKIASGFLTTGMWIIDPIIFSMIFIVLLAFTLYFMALEKDEKDQIQGILCRFKQKKVDQLL